jgi:N-acetylmuramoyl-L-alanine amidase
MAPMKRTVLLAGLAAFILLLSAAGPSTAQTQIPTSEEIIAYLRQHPIIATTGARVNEVFFQGEALVIDLGQEMLPDGAYNPDVFNQLQTDLDLTFQINQRFLTTFKIEGLTLDHWGQPLPSFDDVASLPEIRDLPGSGPLSGVRIALSPGHGLYWNEYFGEWRYQRIEFFGIREDIVNSQIMRYLEAALLNQGATVIPTRELDLNARIGATSYPAWYESARQFAIAEGLPSWIWTGGSNNYNSDIRTRPYMANYYGADILISLHNNGWDGSLRGTETYYDTNNHAGSPVLATYVHNEIINTLRLEYDPEWTNRGIKSSDDNYGEINYALMPAILLELAFMDNYEDNQALQDEGFKILAAEAITRGICKFRGTTCEDVNITLPVTMEAPSLSPTYGDGMCDSGWKRYTNSRERDAFLALNAQDEGRSTNFAAWAPNLPLSGEYQIEAFIPAHGAAAWQCPDKTIATDSEQSTYDISHANGVSTVTVNQAQSSGAWANLGVFHINEETNPRVKLRDLTGETQDSKTVSASAMRFTLVGKAGIPFHNTAWAPESWITDQVGTSSNTIRNFLKYYHSCLADPIEDTDGEEIDIPTLIQSAAGEYQISPTLLLGIMESQSGALKQCPNADALANLMGLSSPETARGQIAAAAEALSLALDALVDNGTTPLGWETGAPKTTLDGVPVIPANDAITLLFDYTQLAGSAWGGDQLEEPGVHGVYIAYRDYRLDRPLFRDVFQYFMPVFNK